MGVGQAEKDAVPSKLRLYQAKSHIELLDIFFFRFSRIVSD
jgi:hypothetical protein